MKSRSNNNFLLTANTEGPAVAGKALSELMQAVVRKNIPFRFRAGGCSMAPFIKDGDILTVYPLSTVCPAIGDVAAFRHPVSGRLTVHRIVARQAFCYHMKGDSLEAADGPVAPENIIGIVRKVERKGRRILLGLGPEKLLVALLSANGMLARALRTLRRLYKSLQEAR